MVSAMDRKDRDVSILDSSRNHVHIVVDDKGDHQDNGFRDAADRHTKTIPSAIFY